jgi:hypothetical protein
VFCIKSTKLYIYSTTKKLSQREKPLNVDRSFSDPLALTHHPIAKKKRYSSDFFVVVFCIKSRFFSLFSDFSPLPTQRRSSVKKSPQVSQVSLTSCYQPLTRDVSVRRHNRRTSHCQKKDTLLTFCCLCFV